jgi:hypothetical protein
VAAAAFAVVATQLPGRLLTGSGVRDPLIAAVIAAACLAAVAAVHWIPRIGRMAGKRAI